MIPPALIVTRVSGKVIPVPVLLLWPLVPVLFMLALVVLPFVQIKNTTAADRVRLPVACLLVLCTLRGLQVDVESANGDVVRIRCW